MTNARTISVTSARGTKTVQTALTLEQAIEVLRPNDRNRFAQDLIAEYDMRRRRRQSLTNNKQNWLLVMAQEDLDRARQPAPAGEQLTADFSALTDLFQRAVLSGKKFPKILLQAGDGQPVMLAVAGPNSKAPGSLNVTDGGKYGANTWFGRVTTAGVWEPARAATAAVTDLLRRFAADPAGVAAEYGRTTGICCFCQAELTDERSILVGYGPVCADRHSLPWGDRPAKPVSRTRPTVDDPEPDDVDPMTVPFPAQHMTWAAQTTAHTGKSAIVRAVAEQRGIPLVEIPLVDPEEGAVVIAEQGAGETHERMAERYRELSYEGLVQRAMPAARELAGSIAGRSENTAPWMDAD